MLMPVRFAAWMGQTGDKANRHQVATAEEDDRDLPEVAAPPLRSRIGAGWVTITSTLRLAR